MSTWKIGPSGNSISTSGALNPISRSCRKTFNCCCDIICFSFRTAQSLASSVSALPSVCAHLRLFFSSFCLPSKRKQETRGNDCSLRQTTTTKNLAFLTKYSYLTGALVLQRDFLGYTERKSVSGVR